MNWNLHLEQFSRILQEPILLPLGRTHFLFSFLSRQERGERNQVLCRIFISEIETRPHQGSLWSECINGSSHISSELFLGILNHKYESHYCVWMEIFYGLRLVSLIGLVRKLLFGGWEEGTHKASPALQPKNKRKKHFVGSRGVYLILATWHGSKMKSEFKFSRNITKLIMDHRSLEPESRIGDAHSCLFDRRVDGTCPRSHSEWLAGLCLKAHFLALWSAALSTMWS